MFIDLINSVYIKTFPYWCSEKNQSSDLVDV